MSVMSTPFWFWVKVDSVVSPLSEGDSGAVSAGSTVDSLGAVSDSTGSILTFEASFVESPQAESVRAAAKGSTATATSFFFKDAVVLTGGSPWNTCRASWAERDATLILLRI